ncbi:MAG: SUMF1/EgtB/PvdO family nonheme iron enzyme [bacterium]
MGSYLLRAEASGFEPLTVPVLVTRQEQAELTVTLVAAGALPAGCALVPGALPARHAGPARPRPAARARPAAHLPDRPHPRDGGGVRGVRERGGPEARAALLAVPWPEGRDGRLYPEGPGSNPMTGLTSAQVRGYLTWRRERDGLPWRLPTATEWEKAGRGVDGRAFPWGDVWEPSFCRCAEGPEGGAPSPVGSDTDRSPYGVQGHGRGRAGVDVDGAPPRPTPPGGEGGQLRGRPRLVPPGRVRLPQGRSGGGGRRFRLALDASAVLADDPVAR